MSEAETPPEMEEVEKEEGEETNGQRLRREAWDFIQGECFNKGSINMDTVSIWLRTLLDQNSRLVETLNRTSSAQKDVKSSEDRTTLTDQRTTRPSKGRRSLSFTNLKTINHSSGGIIEHAVSESDLDRSARTDKFDHVTDSFLVKVPNTHSDRHAGCDNSSHSQRINIESEDLNSPLLDTVNRIRSPDSSLQQSESKDTSEEDMKKLRQENEEFKEYLESADEQNRYLRDYTDNLKNDIECLLKISDKARDTGVWDPHGLNFCVVTFEQVYGSQKASSGQHQLQQKAETKSRGKTEEKEESSLYDSRSSLNSEIAELEKTKRIQSLSREEYCEVKSLRKEIVSLQGKLSKQVREGVDRDGIITSLQLQITEISDEMEELRVENNANLSVIDKLKDDLHAARSRLIASSNVELNIAKHASVTSLPEIPAYTSRFAKNLSRKSSQNQLVIKMTDQLQAVTRDKMSLEEERKDLVDRLEETQSKKSTLQLDLEFVQQEFEHLMGEHEKLKGDFRTLVRMNKPTEKPKPKFQWMLAPSEAEDMRQRAPAFGNVNSDGQCQSLEDNNEDDSFETAIFVQSAEFNNTNDLKPCSDALESDQNRTKISRNETISDSFEGQSVEMNQNDAKMEQKEAQNAEKESKKKPKKSKKTSGSRRKKNSVLSGLRGGEPEPDRENNKNLDEKERELELATLALDLQ